MCLVFRSYILPVITTNKTYRYANLCIHVASIVNCNTCRLDVYNVLTRFDPRYKSRTKVGVAEIGRAKN